MNPIPTDILSTVGAPFGGDWSPIKDLCLPTGNAAVIVQWWTSIPTASHNRLFKSCKLISPKKKINMIITEKNLISGAWYQATSNYIITFRNIVRDLMILNGLGTFRTTIMSFDYFVRKEEWKVVYWQWKQNKTDEEDECFSSILWCRAYSQI